MASPSPWSPSSAAAWVAALSALAAATGHLYAILEFDKHGPGSHEDDLVLLHGVSKPVPALALSLLVQHWAAPSVYTSRIRLGLVFSAVADVFLLHKDNVAMFKGGIVFFLLAQVLYAAALRSGVTAGNGESSRPPLGVVWLVPAAAYLVWIGSKILPAIPSDLRPPILVYMLVIGVMAQGAFARIGFNTARESLAWQIICAIGAAVFLASDTMIALDKFVAPIPTANLWIMITYWVAQLFIAASVRRPPAPSKGKTH